MRPQLLAICLFSLAAGCQPNTTDNPVQNTVLIDGIKANIPAAELTAQCESLVLTANTQFTQLEQQTTPATLATVVSTFDDIIDTLMPVNHVWYLRAVHPQADIREAANDCSEAVSEFYTRVSLSQAYYKRLAAIDLAELSVTEQFMVKRSLDNFKRSGVDRDEATRARISQLQNEITEIGNAFDKNITDDVRFVMAKKEQLKGLPDDYLANHPADKNGLIKITTDYPDLYPVLTYGENDELRHQLRIASRDRGYPVNAEILKKLIQKRHELALLLGFENYAALSMSANMIQTPLNAQNFLSNVSQAIKAPVKKELDILLSRLQKINPNAKQVEVWQASYLMNLIRQEDYAVDAKEVRQYFQYDNVRNGIFALTEQLFSVTIRPWQTETWHNDVETFEILENDQIIARFYLDSHPRENKYQHAAHWTLRTGIKDKQIPLSGLAQNFPKGLMEHGQVETFLHEFGHLLHNAFSGNQHWYDIAGMSMEHDFVEAPSQMLEEWIWDYDTLKTFARNEQGDVIPKSLVDKMIRARNFGLATSTATQLYYANLALQYYSQDPTTIDLDQIMLTLEATHSPYPHVKGTHFYANFGHLNGYGSDYYTYQWSLAIATDLFSRFQAKGLNNKALANEYRHKVLGAAGSKPAADFIADFLQRPFQPNAYIDKLKAL